MDIYHFTYSRYIDLMERLKTEVGKLANEKHPAHQQKEQTDNVISLIDSSIDTAAGETFLPTGELLAITNELCKMKNGTARSCSASKESFRQCFQTIHSAALSLTNITSDCALSHTLECVAQEI